MPMNLKLGDDVRFADRNTVAHPTDNEPARLAKGVINGFYIEGPDGTIFWPVWAEREGREPTTIMVAESNIVP